MSFWPGLVQAGICPNLLNFFKEKIENLKACLKKSILLSIFFSTTLPLHLSWASTPHFPSLLPGQTPKRRTFKFGGQDSILRTRDPNVIVEEFEENYQLSDSILQAFDAEDLDNSVSSDVSAATADSGRPGSRATSRDPIGAEGGPRAAFKPVNWRSWKTLLNPIF